MTRRANLASQTMSISCVRTLVIPTLAPTIQVVTFLAQRTRTPALFETPQLTNVKTPDYRPLTFLSRNQPRILSRMSKYHQKRAAPSGTTNPSQDGWDMDIIQTPGRFRYVPEKRGAWAEASRLSRIYASICPYVRFRLYSFPCLSLLHHRRGPYTPLQESLPPPLSTTPTLCADRSVLLRTSNDPPRQDDVEPRVRSIHAVRAQKDPRSPPSIPLLILLVRDRHIPYATLAPASFILGRLAQPGARRTLRS